MPKADANIFKRQITQQPHNQDINTSTQDPTTNHLPPPSKVALHKQQSFQKSDNEKVTIQKKPEGEMNLFYNRNVLVPYKDLPN